jgi:hypothetical protein
MKKTLADKTWAQFKAHFSAARRQHKQMQGKAAATSWYHSANAAVGQTEDQMAEATIGALANLATATAEDRGVEVTLTEAKRTSCQAARGQLKRVAGTQGFDQEGKN